MKILEKPFLFLFFVLSGTGTIGQVHIERPGPEFTVVIDAGHGGHDPGTMDVEGRSEKDINLYVAKFVEHYMDRLAPHIRVVLTRESDVFLPLERRPLYAKASGADLFISLHCNHSPSSSENGAEIYVQRGGNMGHLPNLESAERFANVLDRVLELGLNHASRGILQSDFLVLRESISYVPGVLIEMGYFSNDGESDYLNSKKGIKGLSLAITKSIMEYFEERK